MKVPTATIRLMRLRTILLSALLAPPPATAASQPALRPHPRLQVDAPLLRQIRLLRDTGDPAWIRLERWSQAKPAERPAANVQALYGRMLVFLVRGDRAQFDAAWAAVRARIYR